MPRQLLPSVSPRTPLLVMRPPRSDLALPVTESRRLAACALQQFVGAQFAREVAASSAHVDTQLGGLGGDLANTAEGRGGEQEESRRRPG